MTKDDHIREMIQTAIDRGFTPSVVLFDCWCSGIENLKFLRNLGLNWFTRLKKNHQVNPDRSGNVGVGTLTLPADERKYIKEILFYSCLSFCKSKRKGPRATNILQMNYADRKKLQTICWTIEN